MKERWGRHIVLFFFILVKIFLLVCLCYCLIGSLSLLSPFFLSDCDKVHVIFTDIQDCYGSLILALKHASVVILYSSILFAIDDVLQ